MSASSQRKRAVESGLNPDVSRPRAVDPDQSANLNRRGTLRRVVPQLIIRDQPVVGEVPGDESAEPDVVVVEETVVLTEPAAPDEE